MFRWYCAACQARRPTIADTAVAPKCKCGAEMTRAAEGGTAVVMETLDNGAMTRRLTRPADAERLNAERIAGRDPRSGGVIRVDKTSTQ
jgi:hypothetical protein